MMTPNELLLWRRQRRLTQAQLAAYLGVSREAYNRWETGRAKHGVPSKYLPAIASWDTDASRQDIS